MSVSAGAFILLKLPVPIIFTRIVQGSPTERASGVTETSARSNLPMAPVKFLGLPSLGSGRIWSFKGFIGTSKRMRLPEPNESILSIIDMPMMSSKDISRLSIPAAENSRSYEPAFKGVMTVLYITNNLFGSLSVSMTGSSLKAGHSNASIFFICGTICDIL